MSVAGISQLERGDQGVSDKALAALAHAYDCDIGDLFRDPTKPDYQLWRIIIGLEPEEQKRALAVIKAMTGQAA